MKRIINAAFAAVLLGLPACSDDPANPIDMQVHEVVAGPNNRVLVVGDTPHDVMCAQVAGAIAVAVATGSSSVEELRATGAEHAFADLANTRAFLKLLE